MASLEKLCALLLFLPMLSPMALATGSSDTVNERFAVTRAEMEAHWRVDCDASWGSLQEIANTFGRVGNCKIPPDLVRQLQLCEFIHQPPGSSSTGNCPDYHAAKHALTREDCDSVIPLLQSALECRE